MATSTQASNYEFSQIIEDISRTIPPKTVKYVRVCYLLASILPSTTLKTVLNGSNLLSTIFIETLKDQEGGRARFWYVLKETSACSEDLLGKIQNSIPSTYFVPDKIAEMVHLRSMILKIVSELANDKNKAIGLINTAGTMLMPPVIYSALPKSPEVNDYTVPLLKFFETTEEQCEVEPDNLDNLRQWLTNIGGKKIIKDYVDTFDRNKKIKILGADVEHRLFSEGSVEEEHQPSPRESEMVPGNGGGGIKNLY